MRWRRLPGLALIVWGFAEYRATGWIDVWYPPKAFKHITVALMLPAVILVVASYIRGRIYTTLKHPMLAGVKLWAAAHLLANGDLGSIILFGSFLGWAVFDRISLKHRADSGAPPIPVGGPGNDLIAVAVGVVAYLALAFAFHPVVIGVPVVGSLDADRPSSAPSADRTDIVARIANGAVKQRVREGTSAMGLRSLY